MKGNIRQTINNIILDLVDQFSKCSGIHFNVNKCKITAFIQELTSTPRKIDRDAALRARLAHVNLTSRPIGSLNHDEPLSRGHLGTSLTASLCPDAHLSWTKEQLRKIGKGFARAPLPPHIKQRLLLYGAHSKIAHTHCNRQLSLT